MNPASFNYMLDILEQMEEQDKRLDQNPLDARANSVWKSLYAELGNAEVVQYVKE